jgi:hypothetical protein
LVHKESEKQGYKFKDILFFMLNDHKKTFDKHFNKSSISKFEFKSEKVKYSSDVDSEQFIGSLLQFKLNIEFANDKKSKIIRDFNLYELKFDKSKIKIKGTLENTDNFLDGSKEKFRYCLKALYDKFTNESAPELSKFIAIIVLILFRT